MEFLKYLVVCVAVMLCNISISCSQTDAELLKLLLRQMMTQQDYVEEANRQAGGSGIKQIRGLEGGTRPYFFNTHTGDQMMSMHDHGNYQRTVGLGEFSVVLNGVEFRTRHNDYFLYQPSGNNTDYNSNDLIPLPEVPPEVSQKTGVEAQMNEMIEWFKAFQAQDSSSRDYRKYFKPILCYLEGAWFESTEEIVESFFSERHALDAKNWKNMQQKIQFDAYSGNKNRLENHAWLPTRILQLANDTTPVVAQWNYRIRCAPVKLDEDKGLSTKKFRVVDDLATRMARKLTLQQHEKTRKARFTLGRWTEWKEEQSYERSIIDDLMAQIPGFDNYPANTQDNAYGNLAVNASNRPINTGYYHRRFQAAEGDAMGRTGRIRSFADPSVFMAQNTQAKVPAMEYEQCSETSCQSGKQKWSWAIPLEVVYLTPLLSWNPYNLQVDTKQRYTRTPDEFFTGPEIDPHPADTTGGTEEVADGSGVKHRVRASGTRVFLPTIKNLQGNIRLRYPIVPLHNEGNQIYKELEALKDIVMELEKYKNMLKDPPTLDCSKCDQKPNTGGITFTVPPTVYALLVFILVQLW